MEIRKVINLTPAIDSSGLRISASGIDTIEASSNKETGKITEVSFVFDRPRPPDIASCNRVFPEEAQKLKEFIDTLPIGVSKRLVALLRRDPTYQIYNDLDFPFDPSEITPTAEA